MQNGPVSLRTTYPPRRQAVRAFRIRKVEQLSVSVPLENVLDAVGQTVQAVSALARVFRCPIVLRCVRVPAPRFLLQIKLMSCLLDPARHDAIQCRAKYIWRKHSILESPCPEHEQLHGRSGMSRFSDSELGRFDSSGTSSSLLWPCSSPSVLVS